MLRSFVTLLCLCTTVLSQKCYTTINGQNFPDLIDVTLQDLQYGLKTGLFTSVDLVNAYFDRIKEVNPTLNAVTELNPDALSIASKADALRAAGNLLGPLHGIPVLIKNNIATADKMNNTAGSFALLGAKVPRDSTVAAKLRAAGAIILGKANLSQWAFFRSYNTSNGWSANGGQTFGAYYPQQDPSGSSSGSAVGTSIGLSWAALGTETDGSVISPAEVNNLVGIKPTVGLTSRNLVIPISEHQDTVGTLARTVMDAAYLLQAIAGRDPLDNYTSAIPNGTVPIYVAACNFLALSGARFGVPTNAIESYKATYGPDVTTPVLKAFDQMLSILRLAGATIVESNFTALDQFLSSPNEELVLDADFKVDLVNYLKQLTYNPNNIHNLQDLRQYTINNPAEQYPYRDVAVFDEALAAVNQSSPEFYAALQQDMYLGGPGGVLGAISRNKLDAVLLPSQYSFSFSAIVGAPIVTVPMGFYPANTTPVPEGFGVVGTAPNLPFGLSFMGPLFSEASLIGFAYAYEQRTNIRNKVQPYIVPNTELSQVVAARQG